MKLLLLSVYDSKVGAHVEIFTQRSKGEALRGFETAVNDGKSPLSNHPADFALMELGSVDTDTGVVTSLSPILSLGFAADFKRVSARDPSQLSIVGT